MTTHRSPRSVSRPRRSEGHESDTTAARASLRLPVGDLRHRTGHQRRLQRQAELERLDVLGARLEDPLDLDLRLEAIPEGIVVHGAIAGQWHAECSRCLEAVEGVFDVEVHELYEDDPIESETYPIEGDEIDLEPLVRDAVLPSFPAAPLCDESCRGLCPQCGVDRNRQRCSCIERTSDPRWSALAELHFDEPAGGDAPGR